MLDSEMKRENDLNLPDFLTANFLKVALKKSTPTVLLLPSDSGNSSLGIGVGLGSHFFYPSSHSCLNFVDPTSYDACGCGTAIYSHLTK